jgi:hypothetical protein
VKPNGGPAPDVVFEYGTTTAYGRIVAASGSPNATAALTGLAGGTRYHYRVVALRNGRRYEGADKTFVTAPATTPPVIKPPPVRKPDLTAEISTTRSKADRKGRFSFRIRFGRDVEEGTARVTVKSARKTIAKGTFAVRAGATKTVRLKLTRAGRKAIKPGRKARRVSIAVRLPDERKRTGTIRLSRRR